MLKHLLGGLAALAVLAVTPARADIFGGINWTASPNGVDQLVISNTPPPGNQPENAPCIICGTGQPLKNPSIGFNNFQQGGSIANYSVFSTNAGAGGQGGQLADDTVGLPYDGALLRALAAANLSATFSIGIDVNTAQHGETLQRFLILDVGNNTILADFNPVGGYLIGNPINNGSGFPDFFLSGFNLERGDINDNSQIMFFARITGASDGAESFFLVPAVTAVPGPIAGAGIPGLMAALFGLIALNRRRKLAAA
jgi:hypothetical protein